ncbi:MAG: Mfa1 fimbrilin C-terminal domain-containing protein [Muribaculaceae bacterium]|nr:Mfa1 fimbrilin C-terminal domain-containing protein [Muribaculaceae bacterium]
MKLNKWLYGAAALAMLAACSDKDILPDSGGDAPQEGSGFIGVQIQLPNVPSTRAEYDPNKPGNDNFDDGVSSEYKLNDAVLVLFQGKTEAEAQCLGAYELRRSQNNATPDKSDQVTTQVTRVANVTGMSLAAGNDLYALVITNGVANGLLKSDDLYASWMEKKTIKQFQEYVTDNKLYSLDGKNPGEGYASSIVMTNSPLAYLNDANNAAKGGSNNPGVIGGPLPVLVKLNNNVHPTEADALAKPAGTIHVERAVGKITCSSFNTETKVTVTFNNVEYKLEVDEVYWDMAQDMTNTFLVRNTNRFAVDGQTVNLNPSTATDAKMWSWNYISGNITAGTLTAPNGGYRMIGHTPISSTEFDNNGVGTAKEYYRPYFCQVPGYGKVKMVPEKDENGNDTDKLRESTSREAKTFKKEVMNEGEAVKWTTKGAFYPRENTFPVEFMKYANTTRIGFWVTFKFKDKDGKELDFRKSKDFFTKGLDKKTIYLRNDQGYDPLTAAVIADLTENKEIQKAVEAAMDQNNNKGYKDLDLGDLLDFTYDANELAESGEIWITDITFKDVNTLPEKYEGLIIKTPSLEGYDYSFEDDLDRLNNLDQVFEYKGGKVFYEVRIKHFGDDLTPWTAGTNASNIDQSYGTAANATEFRTRNTRYLGRYGIVRNNWYDLQITDITKLGDPQDPAKWDGSWPGKPDDNKDEYIAVVLRVLSWAKRTQSVTF